MTATLFDESGRLRLRELERLSTRQLGAFLRARLQGHDAPTIESREYADRRHYLINALLPHVDRGVRADIQYYFLEFLSELAHPERRDWLNTAGEELLLAAPAVLQPSPNREHALSYFLSVADRPDRYILDSHLNLHYRALQAILECRLRLSTAFWIEQWKTGGNAYAAVVAEGLSLVELASVFRWLRCVDWTSEVEAAMFAILPSLFEDYGTGRVERIVAALSTSLSPSARVALAEFFEDSDIDFVSEKIIDDVLGAETTSYREALVNRLYTIDDSRRELRPASRAAL